MNRALQILHKHPVAVFIALTFLINWFGIALNVAGVFPAFGEYGISYQDQHIALFRGRRTLLTWVPNIVVFIILMVTAGWHGVWKVFKQFFHWRVGWKWWLIVFGFPLMISLASIGIYWCLGGTVSFRYAQDILPIFMIRFFFSLSLGSFGEEAGWRGFALPQLEHRYGPLRAAVFLGIIWTLWHIPGLTIRPTGLAYFPSFVISAICFSILLSWIYFQTKSLLLVAVFHNMMNAVDATLTFTFVRLVSRVDVMPYFSAAMFLALACVMRRTKGRLK